MKDREKPDGTLTERPSFWLAVDRRNPSAITAQQASREVSKSDDDNRRHKLYLTTKKPCAVLDFSGKRVAIFRRSAFDDIRDVHLVAD